MKYKSCLVQHISWNACYFNRCASIIIIIVVVIIFIIFIFISIKLIRRYSFSHSSRASQGSMCNVMFTVWVMKDVKRDSIAL